jgi:Ca2+-binding EF-hand superfamily protein
LRLSVCLLQEFDTNGDGYISQEELSQALASDIADSTQLKDAVREALADADRNHDGRIDYTVRWPELELVANRSAAV